MVTRTNVEITHLVIRADSASAHLTEFLHDASSSDLTAYLRQCYTRVSSHALWSLFGIARQLAESPEYRKPCHIDSVVGTGGAERLYCQPVTDTEFGNHLPDNVTETVGENTDVVIRFGFGILTDPILSMPTHGVLSFHRGDLRSYRGQPGGLWEFLHDEPSAGITLQRIDDSLDAGEIVVEDEVSIADAYTWREVERRQIEVCEGMLAVAIDRLQNPGSEPLTVDSPGTLYTIPRGMEVLTYVKKTLAGNFREFVESDSKIANRGVE
ncbi:formyltransferase family protein (plasmid) [Haladaptatus sp. SPP-AMP-3]|uniref:formyltransferase family protein n=1 Tax=Haladaptatus sp. SPP-AMP-3 TaxID=3121295 RepID=UPI003C2E9839